MMRVKKTYCDNCHAEITGWDADNCRQKDGKDLCWDCRQGKSVVYVWPNGCEIMKCSHYIDGKCNFPSELCKYQQPHGETVELQKEVARLKRENAELRKLLQIEDEQREHSELNRHELTPEQRGEVE
jgi:hypothetical protein